MPHSRLLPAVSGESQPILQQMSRTVRTKSGDVLSARDNLIVLDDVVASIRSDGARPFEVGFVAPGDYLGSEHLFLSEYPRVEAVVMSGGDVSIIDFDTLHAAMMQSPPLREELLRGALLSAANFFRRAADIAGQTIDQRIARWLSDYAALMGTDVLCITHKQIATALGIRRSSVTDALHVIEGERLIRASRSKIYIRDVAGLARYRVD